MLPQSQHFTVSKDEWDTKEENVVMYSGMAKGTWSDAKQWKNQAHRPWP